MTYFSILRDEEIIAASGFFCQGCLVGKPAREQSRDPRYCIFCFDFLRAEAELLPPSQSPKWKPKVIAESSPNTPEQLPVKQDDVSKIPDSGIDSGIGSTCDNGIMKQQKGRPRKEGEVSRVTEWRRKREVQGVLI